ncbi:hypothetical protein [Caballeronia sp. 15711]|uniref:hypothetical protein n=1 Tax=Caballeronia sp. 15711 TaxID=3391029 RepID=UPI0039E61FDA
MLSAGSATFKGGAADPQRHHLGLMPRISYMNVRSTDIWTQRNSALSAKTFLLVKSVEAEHTLTLDLALVSTD